MHSTWYNQASPEELFDIAMRAIIERKKSMTPKVNHMRRVVSKRLLTLTRSEGVVKFLGARHVSSISHDQR